MSARRLARLAVLLAALAMTPAVAIAQAAPPAATAHERSLGRADAPVTVIEYASLVCNHCADWHKDVLPAFKARFIDTGQVRLVYRDLPTPPVEVSATAAALTRCAAPGQAMDVVGALMRGQAALFQGGEVNAWFEQGIAASGRDRADVIACVNASATLDALKADTDAALAAGVNSTPTFFVNGRRMQSHSLDALAAAIEPLLAGR